MTALGTKCLSHFKVGVCRKEGTQPLFNTFNSQSLVQF